MSVNTIETMAAAEDAIGRCKITPLTSTDYSEHDFKLFKRGLVLAAMSIPSNHDGGKHGLAGIIDSKEGYRALLGSTAAVFTPTPKPDENGPSVSETTTSRPRWPRPPPSTMMAV